MAIPRKQQSIQPVDLHRDIILYFSVQTTGFLILQVKDKVMIRFKIPFRMGKMKFLPNHQ
jgi:hypothetical protein